MAIRLHLCSVVFFVSLVPAAFGEPWQGTAIHCVPSKGAVLVETILVSRPPVPRDHPSWPTRLIAAPPAQGQCDTGRGQISWFLTATSRGGDLQGGTFLHLAIDGVPAAINLDLARRIDSVTLYRNAPGLDVNFWWFQIAGPTLFGTAQEREKAPWEVQAVAALADGPFDFLDLPTTPCAAPCRSQYDMHMLPPPPTSGAPP